ncbi:tetratricopeptide repeat protein [Nocardia sp. NPDC059240]|uniref:tetratricopeptide repeat protein n=1 Tax=Nocardia sp. NPDC059240 TaxID=3346786 RepID=UPI003692155E
MAIRLRLGPFAEAAADDPLGREYVGWFPRMTEAEAWESGRGMWKLGGRARRERFAFVVGGGNVCAIAEIVDITDRKDRSALVGGLLATGHPVYDAWIGKPDPFANTSRNPVAYEALPEEAPYLKRQCYCGCGEFTTSGDFLPGHDVRALQDRVRLFFGSSAKDFLDWFDTTFADNGAGAAPLYELAELAKRRGDLTGAEDLWNRAAALGSAKAMASLGVLHTIFGKDPQDGEMWYRRGAEAGDVTAMTGLGAMLSARSDIEGESWLIRAADTGSAEAMFTLAEILHSRGDHAEARSWFLRAADAGHVRAMVSLGDLILKRGDEREAVDWYTQAAGHGDTRAMFRLGNYYLKRGSEERARGWFLQAAEHDHPGAMYALGLMRRRAGDQEAAQSWWRRAADLGHHQAIDGLKGLSA